MPHASNQPSLQADACRPQRESSPESTAVQSYNSTDPIPNLLPHPSSPPSDSSEAFNTASARIHFGPFRSPEKQIIPVLNHGTGLHTPLRRSPRRSVANLGLQSNYSPLLNSQPGDDANEEQEQATPPRMGTPIDDFATEDADEPSSVLANRISRAHDNPSPPPDPIPSLPLGMPTITTTSPASSPSPRQDFPNSGSNSPGTLSPPPSPRPINYFDFHRIHPEPIVHLELPQQSTHNESASDSNDERDVYEILSFPEPSLNEATPVGVSPSTPQKPHTAETHSITPRRSARITNNKDETPKQNNKGKAKAEPDNSHSTSPAVTLVANQPPINIGVVETPEQPSDSKEFCRELGSLSPGSSNLLTQLVPSSSKKSPQPPFSFSVFPPITAASGKPTKAPLRFSSPRRSPSKSQLQLSVHSDIPQTPARRVLISSSTPHGQSSPEKRLPGLFNGKQPRTPILTMGSTGSPARRVAIMDESMPPLGARLGSSKRSPVKERAGSLEPRFGKSPNIKRQERSRSAEPASIYKPLTNKPSPLPYPLQPVAEEQSGAPSSKVDVKPKLVGPLGSSPMKSNLRQPSSKIPRMDLGPYARRSNTKTTGRKEPQSTRPARALDSIKPIENRKATPTLRIEKNSSNPIPASGVGRQVIPTSYLKRKRELDNVPPASASSDVDTAEQTQQHPMPQPLTDQGLLGQPPNENLAPTPEPPQHATSEIEHNTIINAPSPPAPRDSSPICQIRIRSGIRRTTRTRKIDQTALSIDVFGRTKAPVPARQKSTAQSEGPVPGMSAVALKALTNTNTARNQKYLAANLQTEVIRKEGPRPESPTTKVRTVLQRQQEEKSQQRKARAARRARRSNDGPEEHSDSEARGESESPDIPWEEGANRGYQRHQIGPGDEEEYQTPENHDRDPKRRRLDEGTPIKESRRVKWDRGLFTTIYLDQVKLGARPKPANSDIMKGCLAPTAKTVRLDTLGNLPDAAAPLVELVQENVVVKKYVYDNDAEPVPVIAKATRSRSKKEKS
ncbi:hypothetical protein BD779DRAFT_1669076 [Infundibulicybe gibba]|nr:hypothetical protein BD779DRAFT_1669076 [Infundibulicybe gibba]